MISSILKSDYALKIAIFILALVLVTSAFRSYTFYKIQAERSKFDKQISSLKNEIAIKEANLIDLKKSLEELNDKINLKDKEIEKIKSKRVSSEEVNNRIRKETVSDEELKNKMDEILLRLNIASDRIKFVNKCISSGN